MCLKVFPVNLYTNGIYKTVGLRSHLTGYGRGAKLSKAEALRILHQMVLQSFLFEKVSVTLVDCIFGSGFASSHMVTILLFSST
jgi:hypothetical protein